LRSSGIDALDARILLCEVLGFTRAELALRDLQPLDDPARRRFRAWVARRRAGEPIAYIVRRREFYSRDFRVTRAVLVPRAETELLVDIMKDLLPDGSHKRILEIGTGSGVLAVTLALERPAAEVWATDISVAALAVARANARRLGARVRLMHTDWYPKRRAAPFDFIVSNPPYVASLELKLRDDLLRFEPRLALDGGADGMDGLRAVIGRAPAWLRDGGRLLVEHGFDQGSQVCKEFAALGFEGIETWRDLQGHGRVTGGRIR